MKYTYFIPFLMLFFIPVNTTENNFWSQAKETFRGRLYQSFSVPAINLWSTIKTAIFLKKINTANKTTYPAQIEKIESQFVSIKNELYKAEHNAIVGLLKKNGAHSQQIDEVFDILAKLKDFNKEYRSKPQPNIYHDGSTPEYIYQAITNNLKKHQCDPNSIIIADRTKDVDLASAGEDALATSAFHSWYFENDQLFINREHPFIYGTILLLPNLIKEAFQEDQIAMVIHECRHIIEQHAVTCGVLQGISPDKEAILDTPEWNTLKQIHERQADIFPTLEDPNIASSMRRVRSKHHYTEMLYEQHYCQLSHIDELWKRHKYLAEKYSNA